MKLKLHLALLTCLILAAKLMSCSDKPLSPSDEGNSIYYWRTTFSLSDKERKFLRDHNVKKIYLRFFDVNTDMTGKIIPEATVKFVDSVPEGIDIVPTVYLTNWGMNEMRLNEKKYAEKIFRRVKSVCLSNNIPFHELQLDCDWTKSTRNNFFELCRAMKQLMDTTQTLSSTIRLHQLIQTPPPVDKGVLMVYNTGNLMEMTTENSIFSEKDIEPYLRDNRLADYALPLDVAYPAYGWSVSYYRDYDNNYKFSHLMRRTDFEGIPELHKTGKNLYTATSLCEIEDIAGSIWISPQSIIRVERPTGGEILKVKRMIDIQLRDKKHGNILYHLDENQLNHYSHNEIAKIYRRN